MIWRTAGSLAITNSTFSGNRADAGGAFFNLFEGNVKGTVSLGCTIPTANPDGTTVPDSYGTPGSNVCHDAKADSAMDGYEWQAIGDNITSAMLTAGLAQKRLPRR
jgi:hypothetical protein